MSVIKSQRSSSSVEFLHTARELELFTILKCRFYLTKSGKVVKKIYKKSVTKMRGKLKSLRFKMDGYKLTHADIYAAFQSWRSYAKHYDAWHSIRNMERLFDSLFVFNPCYP